MKLSTLFRRRIDGKLAPAAAATLRQLITWAFIALVALFLTHPTAEEQSVFEGPLPLPAELEPLLPP
jgi:hypothetical protein